MIATFKPCKLHGTIDAPPSKSMTHRLLIGAALSGEICTVSGVDYSQDILATIDCLKALGANISTSGDCVTIDPTAFMDAEAPVLDCRESGSTLRFFLPIALCLGRPVTLQGSTRLFERPLNVYEELCNEKGFAFHKASNEVTVCGTLTCGNYTIRGDISSQFISGLIFALVLLKGESTIHILPPFESKSYVNLTLASLSAYGANVSFTDSNTIRIRSAQLHACNNRVEGDYSNAAFLDAFNHLGSNVSITGLYDHSLQGDKIYSVYFDQLSIGCPTIDISDCPDLGPVLLALAAMKHGATFTGTDRLKVKESDRGLAMHQEFVKLGGGLVFGENSITVPAQDLQYKGHVLVGHNDHRIVMALSVILSKIGGAIEGAEAVRKSYPSFFDNIKKLGAEVELI